MDLEFSPPNWTLDEIRKAIPEEVFQHRPALALAVLARDMILILILGSAMSTARQMSGDFEWQHSDDGDSLVEALSSLLVLAAWLVYWWFQGLLFTGIWIIGHECAHESFLPSKISCNVIGLVCHTLLWTPHFSWKLVHHIHHRYHGLMGKDQHWIPQTRSKLKKSSMCMEYLQDAPLFNLLQLIVQQIIGYPLYLWFHVTGPDDYPLFTSHFNPWSILFKPEQRYSVPHYRRSGWNYVRGALATTDRDFLGWQGRFFLHDISHFHVVHHLFPRIPFYNGEIATNHLKALIGKDCLSSGTPVFRSLWDNYRACQFVEDSGDILFYKDSSGKSHRHSL
ncbi:hypothetical protein IW261DRAFT_1506872 [Armillaria novae-zelandiae]|uniref:Fatty acid desaturase domain-containing protein n=1 Tax=Armillaria novae-zelandiae TaxID=153914 RepID=A0AA39NW49_9AGAR|nr:hypothetical protein IW261DRAFT_1506872 [Armillaria novae-zelandiae]